MSDRPAPPRAPAITVALAALVLYIATLAPTYLWSDSAKLALFVHERTYTGAGQELFGLHPLHSLLGAAFALLPIDFAVSQNLMSALAAALALYFVHRAIALATGDLVAANLASAALGVSHLFWWYAVINETYAMVALSLAATLHAALLWQNEHRSRHLALLALAFGLGVANHAMVALLAPGLLVLVIDRPFLRWLGSRGLPIAVGLGALGAAPLWLLPLVHGHALLAVAREALVSTAYHATTFSDGSVDLAREAIRQPYYLAYQFPTIGAALGLLGLTMGFVRSTRVALATFICWLAVVLFASQYFLQRQFPMLIPSFVLFAFWIGLGIAEARERWPRLLTSASTSIGFVLLTVAPPFVYLGTWQLTARFAPDTIKVRELPERDNLRYFLFPPKWMETGAARYAETALEQAGRDALILADFNPAMALRYARDVDGLRRDVDIAIEVDGWVHRGVTPEDGILAWLDQHLVAGGRPVYLADTWEPYYRTAAVRARYDLEQKNGPLWRVTIRTILESPRRGTTP